MSWHKYGRWLELREESIVTLSSNMKEIILSLPKGTSLPIDIDQLKLYQLSKISIVFHEHLLIFNIKVSLIDQ